MGFAIMGSWLRAVRLQRITLLGEVDYLRKVAIMVPIIMLATSFMRVPAPGAPRWNFALPITSSGRATASVTPGRHNAQRPVDGL
jgi:hypothetical protein